MPAKTPRRKRDRAGQASRGKHGKPRGRSPATTDLSAFGEKLTAYILLPLILIMGVVMRLSPELLLSFGQRKSVGIWFDEIWALMLRGLPPLDALYTIHHFDAVPPLSYLFLALTPVLPDGTVSKIIPGVFSALALFALLWFGKKHMLRDELRIAGVLAAISPILYWHAINLRYYAILDLVSVLWLIVTTKLLAAGRSARYDGAGGHGTVAPLMQVWLLLSAIGLLLHHTFAIALLCGIAVLVVSLGRSAAALLKNPVSYAWFLLPLGYWLRVLFWQKAFVGGYKTAFSMPSVSKLLSVYRDFLLLYANASPYLAILLIAIPFGFLIHHFIARARAGELLPVLPVVSFYVALLPPALLLALTHISGNPALFNRRYLIPSGIAFIIAWAIGCARVRPAALRLALLLAVILFNLIGLHATLFRRPTPDWQAAARIVSQYTAGRTLVLSFEPDDNLVVAYSGCLSAYLLPYEGRGLSHYALAESGPSPQVFALTARTGAMGGKAVEAYYRYYPPVLSIPELSQKLADERKHGELPDRIFAVYNAAGETPPAPEELIGDALKPLYAFSERRECYGVAVDEWRLSG